MGDVDADWARYRQSRSIEDRNAVAAHYHALVTSMVARIGTPRGRTSEHVDADDLRQLGYLGLLDAIARWDPARSLAFVPYATFRIRQYVLDEMRKLQWVPRSIKDAKRSLVAARNDLTHRLGREPTSAELAERLGMSAAEFTRLRAEVERERVDDLDATPAGQEESALEELHSGDDTEAAVMLNELRQGLISIIESLDDRLRVVLALYYIEQLTYEEVGRAVGYSGGWASGTLTEATRAINARLQGVGAGDLLRRMG